MSIAANKVRECAGIAQENMQKACISSLIAGFFERRFEK
jgi:hypothetical protein